MKNAPGLFDVQMSAFGEAALICSLERSYMRTARRRNWYVDVPQKWGAWEHDPSIGDRWCNA